MTPSHKRPIRIEGRGTLGNPIFLSSVAAVVLGALLAGEGQVRLGGICLAIGLPCLLIATIWSLVR